VARAGAVRPQLRLRAATAHATTAPRHAAGGTELTWTIRFRPRIPVTGALLRAAMGRLLRSALQRKLKPLIETTPLAAPEAAR